MVHDDRKVTLGRLQPYEVFVYEFDPGDGWLHLCTVGPQRVDPLNELGIVPDRPMAYWGWDRCPTSTAGGGTATMASPAFPVTPRAATFPRSGPGSTGADGLRRLIRLSIQRRWSDRHL
jgi:hypothetical protein